MKKWEKHIVFQHKLTNDKIIEFALKYRLSENCELTALDDTNDPGEANDIFFMRPRFGEDELNQKNESRIANIMKHTFTIDTYESVSLTNDIGYVIVYPWQIKIGAICKKDPYADREAPPEEMVQAALKLLPGDNIESIKDEIDR